jgi:predicted metal-dependent enzyme (double-stranded beta helix superfamily)
MTPYEKAAARVPPPDRARKTNTTPGLVDLSDGGNLGISVIGAFMNIGVEHDVMKAVNMARQASRSKNGEENTCLEEVEVIKLFPE